MSWNAGARDRGKSSIRSSFNPVAVPWTDHAIFDADDIRSVIYPIHSRPLPSSAHATRGAYATRGHRDIIANSRWTNEKWRFSFRRAHVRIVVRHSREKMGRRLVLVGKSRSVDFTASTWLTVYRIVRLAQSTRALTVNLVLVRRLEHAVELGVSGVAQRYSRQTCF